MPLLAFPSSPNDQNFWMLVAAGGAIALYFLMRQKAKKRDPLDPAPRSSLRRQRDVEDQMNSVLVELSRMANQITAQLDTRAAKLELLIKEADQKLAALRAATEPIQNPEKIELSSRSENVIADAEAAMLHSPPPEPEVKAAASASLGERYGQVYALADEGKPANEIGRILQRPTGEIELILALRPK